MLPEWTVHKFTSVIKEKHFSTFRANFQISDYIPIRLPYVSEKCYYDGVEGVGVYEQMLKAGFRFSLSTLHRELLNYLGLFVNQISPNTWRVFIAMEILYGAMTTVLGSWWCVNSFIATVQTRLIGQGECIVLPVGARCWRSFLKHPTQIETGRVITSS